MRIIEGLPHPTPQTNDLAFAFEQAQKAALFVASVDNEAPPYGLEGLSIGAAAKKKADEIAAAAPETKDAQSNYNPGQRLLEYHNLKQRLANTIDLQKTDRRQTRPVEVLAVYKTIIITGYKDGIEKDDQGAKLTAAQQDEKKKFLIEQFVASVKKMKEKPPNAKSGAGQALLDKAQLGMTPLMVSVSIDPYKVIDEKAASLFIPSQSLRADYLDGVFISNYDEIIFHPNMTYVLEGNKLTDPATHLIHELAHRAKAVAAREKSLARLTESYKNNPTLSSIFLGRFPAGNLADTNIGEDRFDVFVDAKDKKLGVGSNNTRDIEDEADVETRKVAAEAGLTYKDSYYGYLHADLVTGVVSPQIQTKNPMRNFIIMLSLQFKLETQWPLATPPRL